MKKLFVAAAALSMLATPAVADAHGKGHNKHGRDYRHGDRHHGDRYHGDRDYYRDGYRDGYRPVYYRNQAPRDYWRSRNGRYYQDYRSCQRDSNIEGTVIGAIGGGVLGNVVAPRGSKTLGTVIGAGLGGVIGHEIDKGDNVRRCY